MFAYLDSFAGLIPCKVIAIGESKIGLLVCVRLTATHGAYIRGEVTTVTARGVLPRYAVKRRKYSTVIWAYDWRKLAQDNGMVVKELAR